MKIQDRVDENAIIHAAFNEDDWNDHRDALKAAYERWLPESSFESLAESAEEELAALFFETTSLTDGSVLTWNRDNPAYAYQYVESIADLEINY